MSRKKQYRVEDLLRLDTPKGRLIYKRQFLRVVIAHALQKMRAAAGLTQQELAEKANMSQPEISRLERAGGWRAPELSTLTRYAEVCGFDLTLTARPRRSKKRAASIMADLNPPGT